MKIIKNYYLFVLVLTGLLCYMQYDVALAAEQRLPKKAKQTVQGKYVTALEAYDMWLKNQTVLIMCRSGSRGAKAVNRLSTLGFLDVYNITDGFEGDKVKDNRSIYKGKRVCNGWKNALLTWTYDLNPVLAFKN